METHEKEKRDSKNLEDEEKEEETLEAKAGLEIYEKEEAKVQENAFETENRCEENLIRIRQADQLNFTVLVSTLDYQGLVAS